MPDHDATNPPAEDSGSARHTCPHCGEPLLRIPRRFVDRLTSLLSPSQRYRCRKYTCRWQGNIAVQGATSVDAKQSRDR